MFAQELVISDGSRFWEGVELIDPLFGHVEVHDAAL